MIIVGGGAVILVIFKVAVGYEEHMEKIVVFQWKDGSATSVPMDGSNEVEDMIDYVKTSN